jgi:hypothetical protein
MAILIHLETAHRSATASIGDWDIKMMDDDNVQNRILLAS